MKYVVMFYFLLVSFSSELWKWYCIPGRQALDGIRAGSGTKLVCYQNKPIVARKKNKKKRGTFNASTAKKKIFFFSPTTVEIGAAVMEDPPRRKKKVHDSEGNQTSFWIFLSLRWNPRLMLTLFQGFHEKNSEILCFFVFPPQLIRKMTKITSNHKQLDIFHWSIVGS